MDFIPYGKQNITQQDIDSVTTVLKSDFITMGPMIDEFELAIADYCQNRHALAVSSATAALHLACLALDLQQGGRLWTSPNTFVASANCGLYCGAKIDFVDIDPNTYNISVAALEEKLVLAAKTNNLPDILVVVHFAGQSSAMQQIHALSKQYNFRIIEDASHAIGGRYQNKPIGGCQYSDITLFSLHPVKIITSAEGGLLLCQDTKLAAKLKRLRSHGITRDPALMTQSSDGPWYYQQIELGYNYRITDIQCALGVSQLQRLDNFVKQRHYLAERYNDKLKHLPLQLPQQNADCYSSMHLYPILLQNATTRLSVFKALRAVNIGVNVHYIPVYRQPYYQANYQAENFPVMEDYYSRTLTLPLFPDLSIAQQDYVINNLENLVS